MNKEIIKRTFRIIKRKKWPIILAAVILICAVATPFTVIAINNHKRYSVKNPIELSNIFVKKTDREKINLIAHRGFSCQAPENTVSAIQKAAEYGFDTVEIDVRQTSDGVWVVFHDESIEGMTNLRGKLSSFTYFDLITADIDSGANHKLCENKKIPTLTEALSACLQYNIKPMIEIKAYTEDGIDSLLAIIEKNGFTESCSIISFDREVLNKVRAKNKDIMLYALVSKLNKSNLQKCLDNPTIGVSFSGNSGVNTKEKIKQLQNAGISLVCWTIDDAEAMQKYYSMGVTTFVTNRIYKK